MAATYNVTLSKTDVVNLWRKVQGPLRVAANFMYEEWDQLQELDNFEVDWSTRTIEAPMDLDEDSNIASIPEGGYEAKPSSPNPVDASFGWIVLNGRFTISKTARWIDERNKKAMIENQMKYQGRKKLDAMRRRLAQYYYGLPTAIMGLVQANVSSGTNLTVLVFNAFGQSGLDDKFYNASLYRKNEWIAFLNPSGPAIRNFGKITAISTSGTYCSLSVTMNSATALTANDYVVYAASLQEDTATLDSCDYNKGLNGWLHFLTATTVQGIDGSTNANWNVAYANTTAGRMTGLILRKMKQQIKNHGGGTLSDVLWTQGAENDVTAQLQAGLRFQDAFNMEMDGAPKAKGVSLRSTRTVPPGFTIGYDKSSINKMVLLDPPGQPTWDDATKIPDRHGFVVPLDYPCQMVVLNRGNTAYASKRTEQ